jgi:hypothetical protein
VRKLQEQIARSAVARQRLVVDEHRRDVEASVQSLDRAAEIQHGDPTRFVSHRLMLDAGVRDIDRAEHGLALAGVELSGVVRHWTEAAQRLDGIERLDDRVKTADDAETERRESATLDELVVMRWDAEL